MDDPNITMEEYIRLEEEKAHRRGKVYNWETAKYGKIWYDEDVHDLGSNETKFQAIVFNDELSSEKTLSCEPTVSSLNNNEIVFRISFDESNDEDYTVIFNKNLFTYKIFFVNDLKTDLKNDNEKVNMPSFPSPEPKKMGSDDIEFTNEKGSDLEDECSRDVNETTKIFKIEDNLLDYETPLLIMEYLVKISKNARILELKQRNLKITVQTSNTPYPSRKIRRICAYTSLKTTKEQDSIRHIQRRPIRRIQVMGFAAALVVLITRVSQSRQQGKSEPDLTSHLPRACLMMAQAGFSSSL
ncbi:hypothetical protein Tco_0679796 [Tanacetum coccineum]|uniref:Uncharacterized protein n=1 Tax=Tanacetum coccineum TaxID=301880 RepID=A0ABQ4XKA0_9ASTR